ncbi:hypothetical protein SFUMM280S_10895 [Streptomyces fumanus]
MSGPGTLGVPGPFSGYGDRVADDRVWWWTSC